APAATAPPASAPTCRLLYRRIRPSPPPRNSSYPTARPFFPILPLRALVPWWVYLTSRRYAMQLRRPRALKHGDTIAVVAPSSPVSRERLDDGVKQLRAWGFDVRPMPSTATGHGYLAGESDAARAADLVDAFADPEVAGIICVRGGYGAQRLLPLLDWEVIRA